jgi:DNA-directed RNA polymerase subunit H (RpoH/RPB5)
MDANTIRLYYGARKTCLEMLTDRGYTIPPPLPALTFDAFAFSPEKYLELIGITDKQNKHVAVKMFHTDMKFNEMKVECKKFLEIDKDISELDETDMIHLIIAYDPYKAATSAHKIEKDHIGHPYIEVFDVHKLFVNPTKHVYQPKWRLMSDKEVTEMLQRYEANMAQTTRVVLGSVCIDDPMNRYYDGKPAGKDRRGDVFEIIRDGICVFYRKVITKKMNFDGDK